MKKATPKLLLVSALTMALALAGCTSTSNSTQTSGAVDSHLTQILKSKTIKIAVLPDVPPWGSLNTSGAYEGIDIDVANALAKSLGAKIQYVNTTGANRIPLLQTDKVDLVAAAMSNTDQRAQLVEMTRPYAGDGILVVVPKGSNLNSYSQLDGMTAAVPRGSAEEQLMQTQFPKVKLTEFDNVADATQAFKTGKVQIFPTSAALANDLVKTTGQLLNSDVQGLALVALAVKPGDQLWLNYLNNFIGNYVITSAADASYMKWLNSKVPDFIRY